MWKLTTTGYDTVATFETYDQATAARAAGQRVAFKPAAGWDWDDDYRVKILTRETPHGIFRAKIERDEYADAPYFEAGCPVFGYDFRGYGVDVDDTPSYGEDSNRHSGVDFRAALMHFYDRTDRFADAVELTDRWLRIFHGGSVAEISSTVHQGGPYYLTYDTEAMRAHWGQVGDMLATSAPEAEEWQAFIDGEVYTVSVERASDFDEDGDPVDWDELDGEGSACGGHYGELWAQQAAEDALSAEVAHAAANMLPVDES